MGRPHPYRPSALEHSPPGKKALCQHSWDSYLVAVSEEVLQLKLVA